MYDQQTRVILSMVSTLPNPIGISRLADITEMTYNEVADRAALLINDGVLAISHELVKSKDGRERRQWCVSTKADSTDDYGHNYGKGLPI